MSWAIFAISAAFFQATYFTSVKKLLKDINQYVLASGIFISHFAILFSLSIIKGIPEIGPFFYPSVLATAILNAIAVTLYYKALKITDLSLSVPMISFTPVFLIITAFIILRELPTFLGAVGITLIVFGSYVLHLSKNKTHFLDPFRKIFKNKGVSYMLIVAFLWSITLNFDKLVVLNSDPIFGSSLVGLLLGLIFLTTSLAKKQETKIIYKENFSKFFLMGIIIALEAIALNMAFTLQIVPYVISLKRLAILFSVFYGGLAFKEKDLLRRSLATLIMLAGVILIILF